jgi:multidrug efflux system membrane fusion protein
VELGSSVAQGGQVATVLNLDPVLAVGEVSERELGFLQPGDKAEVRLVSGQTAEGTVRYISRDASAQTRTFRIEVAIANGDHRIPAGMTAEITLRVAPVEAVMLPRSVVTLSNNGDLGIRAVGADSRVTFVPIDLVDDTPKGLVLGGVPDGLRIIVAGQDLVSEGDTVTAVDADPQMLQRLAAQAKGG